jgi:hypothetical protein
MEPQGSLACASLDPYPEPDHSNLHPHNFFKIGFNILLSSTLY